MKNSVPLGLHFIEPLEARIAPIADLILQFVSIDFPDTAVPGDSGSMTFTIKNIGDIAATNKTCVNFWLVPDPGAGAAPGNAVYNSSGNNAANAEKIVDGLEDIKLNLKPGDATGKITRKFTLPDMILGQGLVAPTDLLLGYGAGVHPFNMTPGKHYIVAEVDGASENEVFFGANHQNNFAASPDSFDYQYQFGNVGDRGKVDLQTTSGTFNGTTFIGPSANFFLSGGGTGEIQVVNGSPVVNNLVFTGTTTSTSVLAVTFPGTNGVVNPVLHDITAGAPMGKLLMPTMSIDGNVTLNSIAELQLNQIGSPAAHTVLTIGAGATKPMKLTFTKVVEMDFNLSAGVDALTIGEWDNTNPAADTITVPFINKLTTGNKKAGLAGDFEASLTLTGENAAGVALGKATIGGQIRDSQWTITDTNAGRVDDIVANSASGWLFTIATTVDDISITKDLIGEKVSPALEAFTFGDLKVGGKLDASVKANGANAKNVAIEKLSATGVTGITVEMPTGGITLVDVGKWTGGGKIDGLWVKTLTADGLFVPSEGDFSADLTLTGPSNVTGISNSLGKATIKGNITGGTWTLPEGTGDTISAANTGPFWSLAGGTEGTFDEIDIKGNFEGEMTGRFFAKIAVGGELKGKITATGPFAGITKLTAGKIVGAALKSENSPIETITAGEWQGGSLKTDGFDKLRITGNAHAGVRGDLVGVTIEDTSASTSGGSLFVHGGMSNVTYITAPSHDTTVIQAGEWVDGSYTGGKLVKLEINGAAGTSGNLQNVAVKVTGLRGSDPFGIGSVLVKNFVRGNTAIDTVGHLSLIDVGAMINSKVTVADGLNKFEINGIKGATGPFFDSTLVTAKNLFVVAVRDINEAAAASYGFDAQFIQNYSRYTGKTRTVFRLNVTAETFDEVPAAGTGYRVKIG